jgi:hypothetical protein
MESVKMGEGVRWVSMTNGIDSKMKLEGFKKLIDLSKEMAWTS